MNQKTTENIIPNVNSKEKEERNVPDLRCRIIKKCKMFEVVKLIRGSSPRPITNFIGDYKHNWIKIGDINPLTYSIDSCEFKMNDEGIKKSKKVLKGEILLSNSMSFGIPCITNVIGYIHDGWFVIREYQKYFLKSYLVNLLKSNVIKNQYKKMAAGAVVLNISKDIFYNLNVTIPNLEYQNKIGTIMDLIDLKIITQKKIIKDLIILKNSIINNIYGTQKYNCKLDNCITQVSNRNKNGKINLILSVSNKLGFIKQSEQFEEREVASDDVTNYKIIEKNMFAYNPARINVGSIAKYNLNIPSIVSPMYICFKTNNIDANYLNYYFNSNEFKKQMRKRLEGSVRQCLTYESMIKIPFYLPSFDIQKKNAALLTAFINKIDFEKKYLNLLESQKAYLLNKMFI